VYSRQRVGYDRGVDSPPGETDGQPAGRRAWVMVGRGANDRRV